MTETIEIQTAAADIDEAEARQRGIGLVDGTMPGYVILLGDEADLGALEDLQSRKILIFATNAVLRSDLVRKGYTLDWESGILPFDLPAALGFVYKVAQVFGNADSQTGVLGYAHQKLRGFTLLIGESAPEDIVGAKSGLVLNCPLVAAGELPQAVKEWKLTSGNPAVIEWVRLSEIVQIGIEARGIKINYQIPEMPAAYSSEFSGQIVRDENCGVCLSGVELTNIGEDLVDGQVSIMGPDLDNVMSAEQPYGLLVEVSGPEMLPDFEPVLERQIDTILNDLDGVMHRGQRAIASVRISQKDIEKGLRLTHLGKVLHARLHNEFGKIISRVQVTFFTEPEEIQKLKTKAQSVFQQRDQRILGMTDEGVEEFYTCTICQSISSKHVCVISPEHPGVCGAVDWMDARASVKINPIGPNKVVRKENLLDAKMGQWESVNQLVQQESGGGLSAYSLYSMMQDPAPACGDFECITALLPACDGVMLVGRRYKGMTPSGMDWEMLYDVLGTGEPVPGCIGHSKRAVEREKYISAEGGWRRIIWMDQTLREELRPVLNRLAENGGVNGFVDMILTEQDTLMEDEILQMLADRGHPILTMEALI